MMNGLLDPEVELLPDIPISSTSEDLFDRSPLAVRLAELAVAPPPSAPRVVGLTGRAGAGKSSLLQLTTAILAARPGLALVSIDAALHPTAAALMSHIATDLAKVFSAMGVVHERDKMRDTLASYGNLVSGVIRLAGVKVDVASALERSADSLRAEIARCLEQSGQRLVIVIDHLDRLIGTELDSALAALAMYATIASVAIVVAVDRHELATRAPGTADRRGFERLVQVELAIPAADPSLLGRIVASGLQRAAARTRRDVAPALVLFDPDGVAVDLIETPRDAKRVTNALAAALPLLPADANIYLACLEIVLCVLVPELDTARLTTRDRTAVADREQLFAELAVAIERQPRVTAARKALRALVIGD